MSPITNALSHFFFSQFLWEDDKDKKKREITDKEYSESGSLRITKIRNNTSHLVIVFQLCNVKR